MITDIILGFEIVEETSSSANEKMNEIIYVCG